GLAPPPRGHVTDVDRHVHLLLRWRPIRSPFLAVKVRERHDHAVAAQHADAKRTRRTGLRGSADDGGDETTSEQEPSATGQHSAREYTAEATSYGRWSCGD